jgi:hypothetical protein
MESVMADDTAEARRIRAALYGGVDKLNKVDQWALDADRRAEEVAAANAELQRERQQTQPRSDGAEIETRLASYHEYVQDLLSHVVAELEARVDQQIDAMRTQVEQRMADAVSQLRGEFMLEVDQLTIAESADDMQTGTPMSDRLAKMEGALDAIQAALHDLRGLHERQPTELPNPLSRRSRPGLN